MAITSVSINETPVEKLQREQMVGEGLPSVGGSPQQSFNFEEKVAQDIVQDSKNTLRKRIENFNPENFTAEEAADIIGEPVATNALNQDAILDTRRFEVENIDQRILDNRDAASRSGYDRIGLERNEDGTIKEDSIRLPRVYKTTPENTTVYVDGGMNSRSQKLTSLVQDGMLGLGLGGHGFPSYQGKNNPDALTGPELSNDIAQYSKGDVLAAISRSNGMDQNASGFAIPNKVYTDTASLVVENMIFNVLGNESLQQKDALQEAMGESESLLAKGDTISKLPKLTQTTANDAIGQEIHLEYIRMSNAISKSQNDNLKSQGIPEGDSRYQDYQEARRLDSREAQTLGAAFKHLWAEANPELVTRFTGDDKQTAYVLTAQGEAVLELGAVERKLFFPRQIVKPSKVKGQIDNTDVGRNVARYISGGKKKQQMGSMMKEAISNLSGIEHVVDKQRLKILLATALASLVTNETESWAAEINGIGSSSMDKFNASAAMQARRFKNNDKLRYEEAIYDPAANMSAKRNKLANEIRSLTQEIDSLNYLSWNIQGYQGRLTPQQSYFNPTTSKQVRFVLRGNNPAKIKNGSRQERNVRQMFAMLLIPKEIRKEGDKSIVVNQAGDTYLPDKRDYLLTQKQNELYAYGNRLTQLLAISDSDYTNIVDAINSGVSLDSPSFPIVNGFNLNPELELDARLIELIRNNGDDGATYMDALMEFKKYVDFKEGVTDSFETYLNAYIDGKTNGPASNAMLLGNVPQSFKTGVLREGNDSNLDNGDLRDQLMDLANQSIADGWHSLPAEYHAALDNVAMEVFASRDLAKYTIMTFGYGKELDSFGKYIEEVMELITQKKRRESLEEQVKNGTPIVDEGSSDFEDSVNSLMELFKDEGGRAGLAKALNGKYTTSIVSVLGTEAIEARSIMRSIAAQHALMNEPFIMIGPSGMEIHIGGESSTGYDNADLSTYRISPRNLEQNEFEKVTIASFNTEATAAASKTIDGEAIPGQLAYGGAAVAPIQAVDAAVVMMMASGESFRKLTAASNGKPYMHTIYDAFKMDANGYDVMLEEVNKNWMNATMDWSYLKEAKASLERATERFNRKSLRNDTTLTANEAVYMKHLLKIENNRKTGKPEMVNLIRKMPRLTNDLEFDTRKLSNDIYQALKAKGYNVIDPKSEPNLDHLEAFKKVLNKYLNVDRVNSLIKKTETNKVALKAAILKNGYKLPNGKVIALQYYGH